MVDCRGAGCWANASRCWLSGARLRQIQPILTTASLPPARLCARALACIRGDYLVFHGLDFAASAGEVWQIEGANGVGKTSLLRLLAGLSTPAAGSVSWRAQPLPAARETLQRELLYLGHLPAVTGLLSAAENLDYLRRLSGASTHCSVAVALQRVGLPGNDPVPAQRLSAGQRQRLALARFVLLQAPLWIMDEPLTALDELGRAAVAQLLVEHAGRGGIAVVCTHQALTLPPGLLHSFRLADVVTT